MLILNNDIISNHILYPTCGVTLNDVSKRDYNVEHFNSGILCLDMDKYETETVQKQHTGNEKCTVDAILGVNDNFIKNALLYVELKIKATNMHQVFDSELDKKVTHTKDLLRAYGNLHYRRIFVVFSNKLEHQVRSWANRLEKANSEYRPITVKGFNNIWLSVEVNEYQPINKELDIRENLKEVALNDDWNEFYNRIENWRKKANGYKLSNMQEYEYLKSLIDKLEIEFTEC